MKRIILSALLVAFAVAVQAGDAKTCQDKEKGSCCASKVKTSIEAPAGQAGDKAGGSCCASMMKTSIDAPAAQAGDKAEGSCCASKVKTSLDAKEGCPMAEKACCKKGAAKQTAAKRNVLLSPKAASLASN